MARKAIHANSGAINDFLDNKIIGGKIIHYNAGRSTGYGYTRRAPNLLEGITRKAPPLQYVKNFTHVTVVLKRNPNFDSGYSVYTAFPSNGRGR